MRLMAVPADLGRACIIHSVFLAKVEASKQAVPLFMARRAEWRSAPRVYTHSQLSICV